MGQPSALSAAKEFLPAAACSSNRLGGTTECPTSSQPEASSCRNKNVPRTEVCNIKVVKRSNKNTHALDLPIVAKNPRSVYNKVKEFHTLEREEEIDVIFMSETWERENCKLEEIINLEDHSVVLNVYQRK